MVCAFFAIHPVLNIYSITLWKDIYLAYFILLYCLLIYKLFKDSTISYKRLVQLAVVMLLITLVKNSGNYIIWLSFPIVIICLREHWKKLAITLGMVIAINWVIINPVYEMLNIGPGVNVRETVSIPVQQISRVVREHEEELTEREKELILQVLPVEEISELGEKYRSYISDPVRILFQTDVFKANLGDYAKLYLNLAIRYPETYIDAFMAGCYGYWYPEVKYWMIASTNYTDLLTSRVESGDMTFDADAAIYPAATERAINYKEVTQGIMDLRNVPVISCFFSIGLFTIVYLLSILYCVFKKKWDVVVSFFPIFVVLLTCIASPVYAEFRYALPAIVALPFMIAVAGKETSEE